MNKITKSFLCGFFFHAFLTLFMQDWYGLDLYVELVYENWVVIHWSVWIIPMLFCLVVYARIHKKWNG